MSRTCGRKHTRLANNAANDTCVAVRRPRPSLMAPNRALLPGRVREVTPNDQLHCLTEVVVECLQAFVSCAVAVEAQLVG